MSRLLRRALSGVRLDAIAAGRTALGWFLTARAAWEHGDADTAVDRGQRRAPARARRRYFDVLAEALAPAGGRPGPLHGLAGRPGRRLTEVLTVFEAVGRVGRGALVKGLIWRSHLDRLGSRPRRTATSPDVYDAGGEVLLDQRVRVAGQPPPEVRRPPAPGPAGGRRSLLGGIDLAHGRRDDAVHRGDPQAKTFSRRYGPRASWHDAQVELRGPAVRDVEVVFRERWEDPAPLSRLPWYAIRTSAPGGPAPGGSAGGARPAARGLVRRPVAADLPGAPARLPVRPGRRAQRRPGVRQGVAAGPSAGLRRGPVPVVDGGRPRLRRRPAPPARAAAGRRRAAVPRPGRRVHAFAASHSGTRRRWTSCALPAATGSRCSTSRTAPVSRCTCTRRCASWTTCGRQSAATTSTAAPGPTTPS